MPIPTLSQVQSMSDPAPNWRWVAHLPSIQSPQSFGLKSKIPENLQVLNIDGPSPVEAIQLPHTKMPAEGRFQASSNVYYPKFTDVDSAALTLYETEDYRITRYINTWKSIVVDKDYHWGMPKDFKKTLLVEAYGMNNNAPKLTFSIIGVWPSDTQPYDYGYSQSGKLTVSCNFSVDDVEIVSR